MRQRAEDPWLRKQSTRQDSRARRCRRSSSTRSPMQVPRPVKIVVNMGARRRAVSNPKLLDAAVADLEAITGQKAVMTRARKSISNFKLREGMPIGASVTLRGDAHVGVPRPVDQRRRCRASATSAGCPTRASTAAATTRWV